MNKPISIILPKAVGIVVAGLGLALLVFFLGSPETATRADVTAKTAGQTINAECIACHQQPDQVKEFPNGDTISITIDPSAYGKSAHGLQLMECTVCHSDITGFPHPRVDAASRKDYSLAFQDTCKSCHQEQAEQLVDSIHGSLMADGNENAPTCTDCHNPHTQQPVRDAEGNKTITERHEIPLTCARCHSQVFDQYANSVHGAGILEENNLDVATCSDCHGVHQIADPLSNQFRLSSVDTCANCHTDKSIMDKYDLSTNVLNTYVSDFHGTTVTLFSKTSPDQVTNKPVCYDCHGVHDIRKVDDPQKGLQVKENLLTTCKKCHPDATANFPSSWMSHYIPSPEKYPIVYYVDLFYKIFVPSVLGGMSIFVISDAGRKVREWRKRRTPAAVEKAAQPPETPAEKPVNDDAGKEA